MAEVFQPLLEKGDIRYFGLGDEEGCVMLFRTKEKNGPEESMFPGGLHFPLWLSDEQLEELNVLIQVGGRAIPACLAPIDQEIEDRKMIPERVSIMKFLDENEFVAVLILQQPDEPLARVRIYEYFWHAILCAIFYGVPVEIENEVVAAQLQSEFGRLVAEHLDGDDRETLGGG